MASLKALLADRTGEPGWHRLRPPLLPLSDAERSALLDD
jgi:4-hydroxy-tetrahydrodipicolinate synthase